MSGRLRWRNPLEVLRTDNGGEFTSAEFKNCLKKEGIKHELTIPKCPEQNGVAERLSRTLVEMIRSMLAEWRSGSVLGP